MRSRRPSRGEGSKAIGQAGMGWDLTQAMVSFTSNLRFTHFTLQDSNAVLYWNVHFNGSGAKRSRTELLGSHVS